MRKRTIVERVLMMSLKGPWELGFRRFSAKADRKGDCSRPAKAGGNMENRNNMGAWQLKRQTKYSRWQ
jgi:hypothetical protein